MISSFIHSKVVVTRVKSLENDRQGRSRREYSVPESAVWPKMFNGNRERRNGQRLLLYLARLFKFRSRPHCSACALLSLSRFYFLKCRLKCPQVSFRKKAVPALAKYELAYPDFGVGHLLKICTRRWPAYNFFLSGRIELY